MSPYPSPALTLLLFALTLAVRCDDIQPEKVLGTCSRPNLPSNARIRFASPEKTKFASNETIYILCEENQFPHHVQKRLCQHGQWQYPQTRCGKGVAANVVHLKASQCSDTQTPLLSLDLNQTDETPHPLPTNSFHFTRVKENTVLSVFGSHCYRWIVHFERKVEIAFLLVDINLPKVGNIKDTPILNVDVTHRVCKLQHSSYQLIETDEVFGYYFFCDLKSALANETAQYNTDFFMMEIHTTTNRTVSLEAVFVGETYKKMVKKSQTVDCGKMEIQRTGVLEQVELSHTQINCNDSFTEAGGIRKHKFVCDSNGLWQGEWPLCTPKQFCPKEDLTLTMSSSTMVENVGNVYWLSNETWYAIDYSWVRYACTNPDGILVGKPERQCMSGRWSNKVPHCNGVLWSGTTVAIIGFILVTLIIVFSLIVYLSIKAHTKKISRTLESTKNELEANALNKQFSSEYYTDIGLETIYEDCKEVYSTPMYEISDEVRYDAEPRPSNSEPEYLTMTDGRSRSRAGAYEYSNY